MKAGGERKRERKRAKGQGKREGESESVDGDEGVQGRRHVTGDEGDPVVLDDASSQALEGDKVHRIHAGLMDGREEGERLVPGS